MNAAELPPVVTLDGPSGVGKGTAGQICAQRLGWHYLDSGAIYRATAVKASALALADDNHLALVEMAQALSMECRPDPPDSARIFIDGRDVTDQARSETTGDRASRLAQIGVLRRALLARQREMRRPPGLVADGRDMGSVVFADATLKIFLTAAPEVRAQRRYNQLKLKGFDVNLAHLFQTIQGRDARDSERSASPLRAATDAITLDTSTLSINEVVAWILDQIDTKLKLAPGQD